MRDHIEEQIAELDRALLSEIMPDILNGSIWEMDDETIEMILTGIWEYNSDAYSNRVGTLSEYYIQIGHA